MPYNLYILSGPRGLQKCTYIPPLLNNDRFHELLANLHERYGPVLGLPFFRPYIFVSGYEAVREALHNPDFDWRIDLETSQFNYIFSGTKGWYNISYIIAFQQFALLELFIELP